MSKRKGSYWETKAMRILEKAGYCCTKAGGSLGPFDIIALGAQGVRAIQVKGGESPWLSPAERETIAELTLHPVVSKEFWKMQKYKDPVIEIL